MRVIEWTDTYRLGIDLLDSHHRNLVELLNRAYNAISLDRREGEISGIFNELLRYTEYHLQTEEQMMKEVGYSRMYSHVSEHDMFRNKLNELQAGQATEDSKFYAGVIYFLEEWLLSHILLIDKEFAEFVKTVRSNTATD